MKYEIHNLSSLVLMLKCWNICNFLLLGNVGQSRQKLLKNANSEKFRKLFKI